MIFSCLLGHNYKPIKVNHYLDTSYNRSGVPSSKITKFCKICGKIKVEHHYFSGYLTLEDLK